MSHGGGALGSGDVSAEPNLTPLLDLVLQLVMFFMLVANFVMDELSDKIHLPLASQAKPLTAKDQNIMYLNVNREGKVLALHRDPMASPDEIRTFMNQFAKTHVLGEAKARELVTIIIRADKDSRFRDVFKVMSSVKAAGFRKVQLRAEVAGQK
jgi:biopolymer transport protein ExbD